MTSTEYPELKRDLLARGYAYSFFQALRLLRHLHRDESSQKVDDSEAAIRVRPMLSLAFPASDIERIEAVPDDDSPGYRISTTFMGLYGTSSPLPTFYTEDLLDELSRDESVSRDFLDIFNHRLYTLLFQGWQKYRQYFQVVEEKSVLHLERLYCLLGLGSEGLRKDLPNAYGLLRYIGLMTQYPRSQTCLVTLLRDALQGVSLDVIPCILRKAQIPEGQRLRIGQTGSNLGVDSYLGQEIEDRMGKFRIQVGPLKQADFLRFTPGKPGYETLKALTELYVTEPLAYEVELILAAHQAQTVCLGDSVRSVLGVTTWVFSEQSLGEVRTRFAVNRS